MGFVEKAEVIAREAHEGQVRKSDGSPYIVHPIVVAEILKVNGFSDAVVAAGLTHDVLEDTDVREATLRAELGDEVVDIVLGVSEDKSLEWEERKQVYIDTVTKAGDEVKAVSVADKIHNAKDFIRTHGEMGPVVWTKFRKGREKSLWFQRELCDRLKEVWQHPMLDEFEDLVKKLENLA